MRHRGTGGAWGGSLAVLLLVVGVAGCSAGHSGADGGGRSGPSAAVGVPTDASADSPRVSAIEKIIIRTSDSSDSFVQFNYVSDLSKDHMTRDVQLSCDSRGCIVTVGCDNDEQLPCADIAPKITPMKFFATQQTFTLGTPGSDKGSLDVSAGSPHSFAVLTEKIFLDVLGASPDYQLTWQSAAQQSPTPVPVD